MRQRQRPMLRHHSNTLQKLLILGLLMLPGMSVFAQSTAAGKKVSFLVMVSTKEEGVRNGTAIVPMEGAVIRLHLSDGSSFEAISSDMGHAVFAMMPAGCEYIAEISCKGYTTAVYHGEIPERQGFPVEFHTARDSEETTDDVPAFEDRGAADVEGFVVCPASSWERVPAPLPDAFVLYTSSADSVYTTTDSHGYFRFDGIKDRSGKVAVSHMTCKGAEFSAAPENGGRWLWLKMESDPLKLAAAKISASMPVISIVGDTIRYNVAATQKVMHGDRLGDVLERLPGISMENGMVRVMGKPLSEININNYDLFGGSQRDALNYLAGQQINKIDIYEEDDGRNPRSDRRKLIMNVKTKRILKDITDINISASGGADMPVGAGALMPLERWQAGLGGRYFSVPLIASVDVGANNLGIDSGQDVVKIPDTQMGKSALVKPVFASVNVKKALKLNEKKTYALQTLGFDYSFKKKETSSDKETERSYDADRDWATREFSSIQHSFADDMTHRAELRLDSRTGLRPRASVAYSRNESLRTSDLFSSDKTQTLNSGSNEVLLHQISELNSRNYRIDGNAGISKSIAKGFDFNVNISFNGGEGDGSDVRNDSTSTKKTWITSDEGKNSHISANTSITKFWGQKCLTGVYTFDYDHGLQRKLNYDEVVDDDHLSPLTSEESRSNVCRHTLRVNYSFGKLNATAGFQSAHVVDSRELPYDENVDKVFAAPVVGVVWRPLSDFQNRLSISADIRTSVPTLDQLGSVFHDSNPLYVSRGNPGLKQAHALEVAVVGNNIVSGGTVEYSSSFSYMINEIVSTRTYYASETVIDGYTLPAGATFSTYDNYTGGMRWNNNIRYYALVQPLRYKIGLSASYFFSKLPSYVNGRFENYISHMPSLIIGARSNFSAYYKLDFILSGNMDMTESQYYGPMNYSRLSASVFSDNRITDWLFVKAGYKHLSRIPIGERGVRLDTDMLNVSAGVYLMDSKLCIALVFRDILNNTPSINTSAYSNYLETVTAGNMNRYALLSIRYLFNSSEK